MNNNLIVKLKLKKLELKFKNLHLCKKLNNHF